MRTRAAAFGILAAAAFALAARPGPAAPNPVNPALAAAYEQVATKDLGELSVDADRAISRLNALRQKDAGNALNFYLLAAAYSWKSEWSQVLAQLEEGHKAPYSITYQWTGGPDAYRAAFPALRELARQCRDAAPQLGTEKGAALLQNIRKMGRKVAGTQPPGVIPLLLGISLRNLANTALTQLHPPDSPEGTAAGQQLAADRAFAEAFVAEGREKLGEDPGIAIYAMGREHGLTLAQIQAHTRGKKQAAAVTAKLAKLKKEWQAREQPLVAKWLKAMPE